MTQLYGKWVFCIKDNCPESGDGKCRMGKEAVDFLADGKCLFPEFIEYEKEWESLGAYESVKCEEFGIEVDDGQWPCCECNCGAHKDKRKNVTFINPCGDCGGWCKYMGCPGYGCIDWNEDKCEHEDNFGAECPENCPREKKQAVTA